MTTQTLDDNKISTIAHALRVAGDRYIADAKTALDTYTGAAEAAGRRLCEQFERQAREVRDLADLLDQAETIEVRS